MFDDFLGGAQVDGGRAASLATASAYLTQSCASVVDLFTVVTVLTVGQNPVVQPGTVVDLVSSRVVQTQKR